VRLDEEALTKTALKRTGLADFGDPYYQQGLRQLLSSVEEDAPLHPIGRFVTHDFISNYLAQRLWLMEKRKRSPQIFETPLTPPLLITGLARSGTSFLHQMLADDPAHRGIPVWELMRPFPEPEENRTGRDPRVVKMEQTLRLRQPMLPGIDAIHYTRPETPEECIMALGFTFHSLIFSTILPAYGYVEWYMEQEELQQKYREYRWLLQVYQSRQPRQRLVLKAPAHTPYLTYLREAMPGIMFIQTHRDPVACVSSASSLVYTFHLAVADGIDVRRLGVLTLDLYESWFRRNLAFREAHPGLIYDVMYEDLVANPAGVVEAIYDHFGLPWSEEQAQRMLKFVRKNPKGKHGRHRYTAEEFGLADGEIAERLGFYSDQFSLSSRHKIQS
jgi:hypothetical protein